jgi:Tfp pilus assembly protein PilN
MSGEAMDSIKANTPKAEHGIYYTSPADVWDEALFTLGGTLHAAEPWVVPILRAQYGVISSLESVASVVIDREGTQINIFQDGVLRVSYSIDIGIPNLRRQITRKAFDMSSDETSTENANIGIPTALIGALRNALKFYQIQYAPAQCKHILLVSEQVNPSELASQLAEELNLIVEIFDPRSYWDFDNDSKQAFYELSAIQAVTAIGLALRDEISAFPLQLNLRQWPEIPQPSLRVPLIAAGIAAVVILGGSLLVSSVLQRQTEIAKIRVQEANIEIATETATVETLKAKRAMNLEAQKALQDDLKAIAREDNVNWSQIIYQISTRMPKQVWLTHLGSKEKEIRIEGYSKEASAVTEYIEQLNQSSSFQYMILSTMEKQPTPGGHDVVKFWIVGRISPNMMLRHL